VQIARAQVHGAFNGRERKKYLVLVLNGSAFCHEHADGRVRIKLGNVHSRQASAQRTPLHVLGIRARRGRADHDERALAQFGRQSFGQIKRPGRRAARKRLNALKRQNDVAGENDFLENGKKTFGRQTRIPGRHHLRNVDGNQAPVKKLRRHVLGRHAPCQFFHERLLAGSALAHEHDRSPAALDGAKKLLHLAFPAHNRRQVSVARGQRQVLAKPVKERRGARGHGPVHGRLGLEPRKLGKALVILAHPLAQAYPFGRVYDVLRRLPERVERLAYALVLPERFKEDFQVSRVLSAVAPRVLIRGYEHPLGLYGKKRRTRACVSGSDDAGYWSFQAVE
jgi:hypothetical protein